MPSKPRKIDGRLTREFFTSLLFLLSVVGISIWVGINLSASDRGNWGQWIGSFIAAIALLGSAFAVILQARQGESVGWNIALTRLGEIYDQATTNTRLATIINQASDPEWKIEIDPDDVVLAPTEDVWLGSLFLAYEQIFVATKSLSEESKRVWRLYISNQLNKPFIRATFVKDAVASKDYHHDFWKFVRGKQAPSLPEGYSNYVIHPKYFQKTDNKKTTQLLEHEVSARPYSKDDSAFWLSLYRDTEVKKQMYAAPTNSEEDLTEYLADRHVFTVFLDNTPVGGFTITQEKDHLASVGFVLHPNYRGLGIAGKILKLVEVEAKRLGIYTLRADVYADNHPSLRTLESAGFRKFLWLEKNMDFPIEQFD